MPPPPSLRRPAGTPSWQRSPVFRWLRRPVAYWSAVALLAIVTVLVVSQQSARQEQLVETYGQPVRVPVALTLIRPGEPLDAGSVAWQQRPAAAVPAGAATALADGAVAAAAIYPGEVVHTERVAGSAGGLSGRLAADVAAVSVPVAYGVPAVQPGDRVHLVAAYDTLGDEGPPRAVTVARYATVLELDDEAVTVGVSAGEVEPTVAALVWGTITVVAVPPPA